MMATLAKAGSKYDKKHAGGLDDAASALKALRYRLFLLNKMTHTILSTLAGALPNVHVFRRLSNYALIFPNMRE